MKTDAEPHWDEDGEGQPLRSLLYDWGVPAAPAEIEAALRQEFRRRRSRRRRAVWLPLAAGFGLLAAWPVVSTLLEGRRSLPAAPAASTGRTEPSAPRAASVPEPPAPPAIPAAARSTQAGRRPAPAKVPALLVVVEPAQAELLAELGRTARHRTEAVPVVPLPGMPSAEAPAYRAEWAEVAGEWPVVQVVVPTSGR